MKIITSYDKPPIPTRNMDWSAHTDNYEASYEGDGHWSSNEPIGHGATEQEAIDDLKARFQLLAEPEQVHG